MKNKEVNKMDEKDMIGKRIEKIKITGDSVWIVLEDGTALDYTASDDGDSCWTIFKVKVNDKTNV